MGSDRRLIEPACSPTAKIRVVAAVVRRADLYLVCQRPAHKRHGGHWEFPGGKLEPGETVLQGAHRELNEELAVEVTAVGRQLFSIEDPGSAFEIEFHETRITGTPTCLEHQALAWATLAEMSSMNLAPSDQAFVRFLTEQQSTGA
jgi:mutator protein MutT